MDDGIVLLVRHGAGRGRIRGYFDPGLEHIAETAPELFSRIRVHETGDGIAPLEHVVAVVFLLADPLRELYPSCYAEAKQIELWARRRGIPVANPPDALSNGIKSVQAGRWGEAGIPTPAAVRFENREELENAVTSTGFPLLLRGDREHSQVGLQLCRRPEDFSSLSGKSIVYPGVITPFVDTREGYRHYDCPGIWRRFYHKKRALVFGDTVLSSHIYFSKEPIIGSSVSTYKRAQKFPKWIRWLVKRAPQHRAAVAAELAFVEGPPEYRNIMLKAARVLDFSIAAIDYSTLSDGSVILWEANPYPYIPSWRGGSLRWDRRLRDRRAGVWNAFALLLRSLRGAGLAASRSGRLAARPLA